MSVNSITQRGGNEYCDKSWFRKAYLYGKDLALDACRVIGWTSAAVAAILPNIAKAESPDGIVKPELHSPVAEAYIRWVRAESSSGATIKSYVGDLKGKVDRLMTVNATPDTIVDADLRCPPQRSYSIKWGLDMQARPDYPADYDDDLCYVDQTGFNDGTYRLHCRAPKEVGQDTWVNVKCVESTSATKIEDTEELRLVINSVSSVPGSSLVFPIMPLGAYPDGEDETDAIKSGEDPTWALHLNGGAAIAADNYDPDNQTQEGFSGTIEVDGVKGNGALNFPVGLSYVTADVTTAETVGGNEQIVNRIAHCGLASAAWNPGHAWGWFDLRGRLGIGAGVCATGSAEDSNSNLKVEEDWDVLPIRGETGFQAGHKNIGVEFNASKMWGDEDWDNFYFVTGGAYGRW